ncbi:ANTAR domain-containing protein [Modestobacter sp. SSW1-42]|uniref:ANTAR domain-containing protein n=1 Tax=Modestobacter sp. SSW1-42 TaxID=596372 RepID=UPI0039860071
MRPPVPVVFPPEAVHGPSGGPAALVVRTTRGWAVLSGDRDAGPPAEADGLTLVEAMTLADLLASELGAGPEPDRASRRAARTGAAPAAEAVDPRDAEIAALRRTVAQLEHALAARVSIERAIGVLAERHGCTPREAFEELRGRARSQGRPAAALAVEVLDGLPLRATVPGQRHEHHPGEPGRRPATGAGHPVPRPEQARADHPCPERPADDDAVPGTQS